MRESEHSQFRMTVVAVSHVKSHAKVIRGGAFCPPRRFAERLYLLELPSG